MTTNDQIAKTLFDAEADMEDMTQEQMWEYIVRLQNEFWAAVSVVENAFDCEIDTNKELCNYASMDDYMQCEEDEDGC